MTVNIVTGATEATTIEPLTLQPVPQSVGAARRWVLAHLNGYGKRVIESAELLTSEIVTNAINHGRGQVTLALTVGDEVARFEVTDEGSDSEPTVNPDSVPGSLSEGGWGLQLLSYYDATWDHEPTSSGGRLVWYELALFPKSNTAPAGACDAPDRSLEKDPQEV